MNVKNQIRSAGRPCGKINSRNEILNATKLLCLSKNRVQITTRLISDSSGFNVSLIRYYFGNKDGLIQAMLQEQLEGFNVRIQRVISQDVPSVPGSIIQKCFIDASKDVETIALIVRLTGNTLDDENYLESVKHIREYFYHSIQKVIKHDRYFSFDERKNINSQMSTFINLLLSPFVNNSIDINAPTIEEQQRNNYEILTAIIRDKKL
ncbi:TetR/AcrR family transcriptional regulator [Vibrio sp. HN007]|uniref:TetR/AcrR family transcriptional regulator n=1 Tax=Vibrio iocasae TaxID=3098914 RepID=UPI0035D3F152